MTMTDIATLVESGIHNKLVDQYDDAFSLESSHLYGVADDGVFRIAQHPDVYSMLADEEAVSLAVPFDRIAIVTTGWAAPLNADGECDGAPSAHPERRRVRLTVVGTDEGVVSVLRFQDDADNTIVDEGSATGSLADAIAEFLENSRAGV